MGRVLVHKLGWLDGETNTVDCTAVGRLVGTLLNSEFGEMEPTVLGITLLLVVGNALAGLLGTALPV